jgi:hypothetical protein
MPARKQTGTTNPFETPATKPERADQTLPTSESGPRPSVGRIVHYRLTEMDTDHIEAKRAAARRRTKFTDGWPKANDVQIDQCYAMVIVAVGSNDLINGKVLLDGEDEFWLNCPPEGDDAGCWHWPERV